MNTRREYVVSRYPSEPILAVAAVHHLHEVDMRKERSKTLSVVRDALIERYIDKGAKGEMIARLILTLTFNEALGLPPSIPPALAAVPSVSVKDFLKVLIPSRIEDFWKHTPIMEFPARPPAGRSHFRTSQDLLHSLCPLLHDAGSQASVGCCRTRTGYPMLT
jgi:hypothetical protein